MATELDGTTANVAFWMGLAHLPQWSSLFVITPHVVRLSPDGVQFAEALQPQPQPLTEVQQIADAIIQYAGRLRPISLSIERVSYVAQVGRKFVHAVQVELVEEIISSETPVTFQRNGGGATSGKVVGQEPDAGIFYIAFDGRIFKADLPATLKIDQGYLLSKLADQIKKLQELPTRIQSIFHPDGNQGTSVSEHDSELVAEELALLNVPWTRFLWGPPGAGKTYALGKLIEQLLILEPHGKILLLAPSNRAVDVAVEQLVSILEQSDLRKLIAQRRILRFGYPRKPEIIERAELLGPPNLDELTNQVRTLSSKIAKAEHESGSTTEISVLRAEILATQEKIKDAVGQHIQESQVVATTTTLAYLPSSPISNLSWDTILIDEVTMVTPAMCTFLASLAGRRLLLAGDPRQLGPVYKEGGLGEAVREWMGRDIFDRSGISHVEGTNRQIETNDSRMACITSQRRCAPQIWSKVERLYPNVLNRTTERQLQRLLALPPNSGHSIALLDTSQQNGLAFCKNVYGSWQNEYTAELAMEVAYAVAAESKSKISIAIISPYRAQVRLLRKWIRQEYKAERTPYSKIRIEAGTVHQFQGSDADVVIFDMVDGVGRNDLGVLLGGDTGIRLVNVAITRAKGKLIILADKNWCGQNFRPERNPLLWSLIMERDADEVLKVAPPLTIGDGNHGTERGQTESPIEEKLYEAMRKHPELAGVVPQHVIRDQAGAAITRADFAFPELKYAVYCDGKQWHLTPNRWQKDIGQRNKLTELDWAFSVFTGNEINRNPQECANQIVLTYQTRRQRLR